MIDSGEPTEPWMVILPQLPEAPARLKRIGASAVPSARIFPPFWTTKLRPLLKRTFAPGFTNNVTPFDTVSVLVTDTFAFAVISKSSVNVPPMLPTETTFNDLRVALARFE